MYAVGMVEITLQNHTKKNDDSSKVQFPSKVIYYSFFLNFRNEGSATSQKRKIDTDASPQQKKSKLAVTAEIHHSPKNESQKKENPSEKIHYEIEGKERR